MSRQFCELYESDSIVLGDTSTAYPDKSRTLLDIVTSEGKVHLRLTVLNKHLRQLREILTRIPDTECVHELDPSKIMNWEVTGEDKPLVNIVLLCKHCSAVATVNLAEFLQGMKRSIPWVKAGRRKEND